MERRITKIKPQNKTTYSRKKKKPGELQFGHMLNISVLLLSVTKILKSFHIGLGTYTQFTPQPLSTGKYSTHSTIGRAAYGKLAAVHSSLSSLEAKISTMLFVGFSWISTTVILLIWKTRWPLPQKNGERKRERMRMRYCSCTDHGRIILLG